MPLFEGALLVHQEVRYSPSLIFFPILLNFLFINLILSLHLSLNLVSQKVRVTYFLQVL